ncbi:NADH pyrophosphatase [Candidatus Ornithobacterium hominis]|uniref:NUDIX hydrolase n=1 Tax=Candidatus Ornithobacterium hominis TaxID=2497989 RepID=UPI000E5B04BB|nr:NUDIX domain-containing protein [Candidatus Ornithobacterium hominis]SZD72051.1 NADH pyrophosphatase [Candidatus Ornithobacterium hominis]
MNSLFKHCPQCGSTQHSFVNNHKFTCQECEFEYYHNMAAAVMCVIKKEDKYLFTIRNNEPAKGMLDMPGGFVDPGESAKEAAIRELKEELGLDLEASDLEMLDTFPNKYEFKGIHYQTLDIIFRVILNDNVELIIQDEEISDLLWLAAEQVEEEKMGFESSKNVVRKYVK